MAISIGVEDYGGADFARVVATPVPSGAAVHANQTVLEIENHKVTQELEAPASGRLAHRLKPGDRVRLGSPIAYILEEGEADDTVEASLSEAVIASGAEAAPGAPLTVLKATELATLGQGAANSMMSVLGVHVGAIVRSKDTMDFFRNKILDLVTFETSRLLAGAYSPLNSYFAEGRVIARSDVSAGVAFDEGGRLTVCALPGAQALSLREVQSAILDGLMRYMGKALEPAQTSSASFTISDLSASHLTFSFPLLPRGQCLILAILRSESGEYSLIASFDHRVTEGLLVSAFLAELVGRLKSFSRTRPAETEQMVCSFCDKTLAEETGPIGGKGLVRIIDARGADALCCSACWGGW